MASTPDAVKEALVKKSADYAGRQQTYSAMAGTLGMLFTVRSSRSNDGTWITTFIITILRFSTYRTLLKIFSEVNIEKLNWPFSNSPSCARSSRVFLGHIVNVSCSNGIPTHYFKTRRSFYSRFSSSLLRCTRLFKDSSHRLLAERTCGRQVPFIRNVCVLHKTDGNKTGNG